MCIRDSLSEDITNDVIEEGVFRDEYDSDDCDTSKIKEYVNSRFSELAVSFDYADTDHVSDYCNVEEIVQSNIESSMHDDRQYGEYKEQRYSMASEEDLIEDLFDRS